MSDTGSPASLFEYSEEENLTLTEFKDKIQTIRETIQTKFIEINDQLKEEEIRLLEKLNEIENEILNNFELTSKALVEIHESKQQIVSTLKTSLTNLLSKNTLRMYEQEIETIKRNSTIDKSDIQLKWNEIEFEKICELKLVTNKIIVIGDPPVANPTQIEEIPSVHQVSSDFVPIIFHQQSIQPRYSEIARPTEIPRQTEPSLQSNYQCYMLPRLQCPIPREKPPNIPPEKKGKYESDNHWQCPYCSNYNLMKYSFCERCFKTPEK